MAYSCHLSSFTIYIYFYRDNKDSTFYLLLSDILLPFSESSPQKKTSKDNTQVQTNAASYNNSYYNSGNNSAYYGNGQYGAQTYGDNYGYNQWQQYGSTSGYGNYTQWSGYGSSGYY